MNPFATILVPTFNQAQYLGQALDSLLAQTDPSWEAIVVNDGSTDNTAAILEAYAARDPRIRAVHKENGGVASALNTGLIKARGEWVHWLSSDDMFEPEKLAINRHWIKTVPDGNFFFSYFTLLTESNGKKERRGLWGPLPDSTQQILGLFHRNYISGISICVRRSAWEQIGFFNEELYYAQDYDQWLRLLAKSQGVFIPEWTVISRNHAAQGSETFPAACYFDTAKAAIRFINEHSFPQLVPWVDLSDGASAASAIASALDVACDRSAFIYCLGANPALVLRVLEWVFAHEDREHEHREQVCSRIQEVALRDSDDDEWSWMWRQLALALAGGAASFCYSPIEPAELALRLYRSRQVSKDPSLQPVREYLKRFMNIEVPLALPPEAGSARIVFFDVGQVERLSALKEVAQRLADLGYRPMILISTSLSDASSYEWHARAPIVGVESLSHNSLPWLGEFELGVSLPDEEIPIWAGGRQQIRWDDGASAAANLQKILLSQIADEDTTARPVLFLQRVLWGGGAERVVHEIVRNLNRRRYRPVVLTMFDEHGKGPDLPADVETINIQKYFYDAVGGTDFSDLKGSAAKISVVRRLVRKGRTLYRHLLSAELRERFGVGRRIVWLRALVSSTRYSQKGTPSTERDNAPAPSTAPGVDFVGAMSHHGPKANDLSRVLQRFGNDVALIAVMEEATVAAWLAQASIGRPYIASLHTVESHILPRLYPQNDLYLAEKWVFSSACGGASAVVFPSAGARGDLHENFGVSLGKIKVIWNPVDCVQIRRQSWCRVDEVSEWKSAQKTFRMVHVGRLDDEKNHELLLQVCSRLMQRGRDFSLAIVGGGGDREGIELQIKERGLQSRVFLAGEQQNPFPWMSAADALLLTSRFEAFALVLVEAMVCGTAVISADCPTGPGEVLANGEYGLLASNGDCEELVAAVERVMDDDSLKVRLVKHGYRRAEDFDVKKIVPQWEALIDSVFCKER